MEHRQVKVESYNPKWLNFFKNEAQKFKHILKDELLTIHHVGSTSVSELAAKPVIDIIPVVKTITRMEAFYQDFVDYGYEVKGEFGIPFRYFLKKTTDEISFNVHIYEKGNAEIDRLVLFKEYLIKHPDEKQSYQNLKLELAKKYPNDIAGYCDNKSEFINRIDSLSGFHGFRVVRVCTSEEQEAYRKIAYLEIAHRYHIPLSLNISMHDDDTMCQFVIRKDTEIVGIAELELKLDYSCILRLFAIQSDTQNKGVGKYFLTQLERWVREKRFKKMFLHAMEDNEKFYRKLGYTDMAFDDIRPKMICNSLLVDLGKEIG